MPRLQYVQSEKLLSEKSNSGERKLDDDEKNIIAFSQ